MANIACGEAKCYICHKTLTKSCMLSYKRSGSALSVLLYFKLKDVLTEDFPLKFNTFVTGYWKTDHNVTLGQLHFIGPANSHTHALSMHRCIIGLS